jgi:hypothetical protein
MLDLFLPAFFHPFSVGADGGEKVPELSDDFLRPLIVLESVALCSDTAILAVFGSSPEPVGGFLRIGSRVCD